MLEEEYQPRRKLPANLRPPAPPEETFEYTIRDAVAADMPYVREIYNHYVANSVVTFDEDAMTLAEWKTKFEWVSKLDMPFIVAVGASGQVIGFAYVSPWKQKAAYRRTVEDSIYLGPAATGKGLGKVLLKELLAKAKAAGIKEVLAVIVDKGAEGSIRLHENFGFVEVGRLGKVGFKFNRWLGTVLLQKHLK
ncbi:MULTISPECIES: GNAT family N-acetyltransferase [Subtercola]|uniref:N-acetyltransferase family protein n=1 Tax=Subtercola vilae TaxID=2056433 RepID=A0A4T2BXI6_9MICO|nr:MULTISPECIES: GNAT family N-acetyltransferase [Subtercola]MEA9985217.1 N-acetyltransferase family protein [Subtercola sp. RTI3]TIH34556.1 N-acetyltransferase family protein [Subtercola vilae]